MKNIHKFLISVLGTISLLGLAGSSAFAGQPVAGSTKWVVQDTVPVTINSTNNLCVHTSTATGSCMLFAAGTTAAHLKSRVNIDMAAAAHCAWVGKTGLQMTTIGSIIDAAGVNGSGEPAGFNLQAAGSHDDRPSRAAMLYGQVAGFRKGLCSSAVKLGGDVVYAPCTVDGDCASPYGGGTCTASPSLTQQAQAGMFLECAAAASTVKITVRKYLAD